MELTKQEKRSEKSTHAFTETDGFFLSIPTTTIYHIFSNQKHHLNSEQNPKSINYPLILMFLKLIPHILIYTYNQLANRHPFKTKKMFYLPDYNKSIMYENQKVKCTSCGTMFISETNATLCPSCSKKVDNIG